MNLKKLSQSTGKLVKVPQGYWAFVPNPLPPKIEFSSQLVNALSEADRMLGALDWTKNQQHGTVLIVPFFIGDEPVVLVAEILQKRLQVDASPHLGKAQMAHFSEVFTALRRSPMK